MDNKLLKLAVIIVIGVTAGYLGDFITQLMFSK